MRITQRMGFLPASAPASALSPEARCPHEQCHGDRHGQELHWSDGIARRCTRSARRVSLEKVAAYDQVEETRPHSSVGCWVNANGIAGPPFSSKLYARNAPDPGRQSETDTLALRRLRTRLSSATPQPI